MNINSIDDIKRLTAKSEGVDIEYKETTGQLERGIGLIIDSIGESVPSYHLNRYQRSFWFCPLI